LPADLRDRIAQLQPFELLSASMLTQAESGQ
jgi:hypothetical protein